VDSITGSAAGLVGGSVNSRGGAGSDAGAVAADVTGFSDTAPFAGTGGSGGRTTFVGVAGFVGLSATDGFIGGGSSKVIVPSDTRDSSLPPPLRLSVGALD
jgi:hypothetical protein